MGVKRFGGLNHQAQKTLTSRPFGDTSQCTQPILPKFGVNSKKNFRLIQIFSFQYGDTPLHTGARYGHAGVIRILVSADCNPSEQNKVINFMTKRLRPRLFSLLSERGFFRGKSVIKYVVPPFM